MSEATLLQYLTFPNPVIRAHPKAAQKAHKSGSRGTTRNDKYPKIRAIERWHEFSRETLHTCFGGALREILLKTEHDDFEKPPDVNRSYLKILSERGLRDLVSRYHMHIVVKALEVTCSKFLNETVEMTNGEDKTLIKTCSDKFGPDYAGTRSSLSPSPEQDDDILRNIIPGEAKISWSWNSDSLESSHNAESAEVMRDRLENNHGLRQIVHYCICASARYGYILNEKELYVLRVRPFDKDPERQLDYQEFLELTEDNPVVEGISIPWKNHGDKEDELTICMALWALHILAANDGLLSFKYAALRDEKVLKPEERWIAPWPEPSSTQTSFGSLEYVRRSPSPEVQIRDRRLTAREDPESDGEIETDNTLDDDDDDDESESASFRHSQNNSFNSSMSLRINPRSYKRTPKGRVHKLEHVVWPSRKSSRTRRRPRA